MQQEQPIKELLYATCNTATSKGTSKPEFIMPIDTGKYTVTLTSPFGYRLIDGGLSKHRGWDFAGQASDVEIQSIKGGIVKYIGEDEDYYGNRVAVEHMYNNTVFYSVYQHLREINVSMNEEVTQGQVIGIQGGTGGFKTYPVHLHFQTSLDATSSSTILNTAFDPFTGRMMHDEVGSIYAEGLEGGIYNWDYQTGMPTGLWFKSKGYTMYEFESSYFSPNTHATIDYYSQTRIYFNDNKNNGLDYTNLYDYAN